MSFDLFFQTFEHGAPCGIALGEVAAVFGNALVQREDSADSFYWRLDYPAVRDPGQPAFVEVEGKLYPVIACDGSDLYGTIMPGSDPALTTGFMVNRPAGHEAFYAALLHLLRSSHAALFWPGDNALVVGRAQSIEHLAEGMEETLGPAFVASAPAQIVERIRPS